MLCVDCTVNFRISVLILNEKEIYTTIIEPNLLVKTVNTGIVIRLSYNSKRDTHVNRHTKYNMYSITVPAIFALNKLSNCPAGQPRHRA